MCQKNNDNICFDDLFEDLLSIPISSSQSPIVYSPTYDIALIGIEKWYPFDTCKASKIFNHLKELGLLSRGDVIEPKEITTKHLLHFHTQEYLNNIKISNLVEGFYNLEEEKPTSRYTDLSSWLMLPWFVFNGRLLYPMRMQVSGSLLAGMLSLKHGWAINLGGGFNHSFPYRAGSYSAYDDISITTMYLLSKVESVMIIDLCAQQCNGPSRRFMDNPRVHILDVFNQDIYPYDGFAKRGISTKGILDNTCNSKLYLHIVRSKLEEAMDALTPGAVVYVGGVDVADPCGGGMTVSHNAIVERDQLIFLKIRSRGIPIVMLCGSGFSPESYLITAMSIINLQTFGLISISNEGMKSESLKSEAIKSETIKSESVKT